MIVSCENCGARYKLDPARITGRGVRITCPRCKNVFVVYRQQAEATGEVPVSDGAADAAAEAAEDANDDDEATQIFTRAASRPKPAEPVGSKAAAKPAAPAARPAAPTPAPAAAERPPAPKKSARGDVASLDFASVGISGWKVKVRIGLVYDFSDYKTLARYIKDGRVDSDDQISHNGQTWTRLGDISDLESHFFDVYEAAAAGQRDAEAAFGEDRPTRIVGAAALAGKLDSTLDDEPDSDLAATMAAAAAAEDDGDYDSGSTGARKATGPSFNDPFARQRGASGQRRRKSSAQPAAQAAKKDGGKASRGPLVLGLVLLLAAGGAGAWYVTSMNSGPSSQEAAAQAKRDHEVNKAAVQQSAQQYQDELTKDLKETLQETVEDDKGWVTENPEEQLTPVHPGGSGTARSVPPPQQAAGMAVSADMGSGSGSMAAGPVTPQAHYDQGRALFREGRWNDAATSFRQAVAGNPQNADYRTWLGYTLMKAGQLDDARTELVAATNKGSAQAHMHLGDLAAMQGDVGGAVGHYQAYLKLVPGDEARVQAKIDALIR
ncbi:MAG: zinc-ribbon domain-containing protein [Alphaproteobacteria bacterium]|nr:zinc-ribbon domain-containing protein [Alphaproteobacteria bacterium]